MTPSQLRSKLQQLQNKQRQAISRYNQQVRQHNQRVQQKVRNLNAAINRYNQEARAYNNRVRANQQRLRSELIKLRSQPASRYIQFRQSVVRVSTAYERLDERSSSSNLTPQENFFVDLSEREAANTVSLFNALEQSGQEAEGESDSSELQKTRIDDEIAVVSEDLDSRWRGALFALNPRNPEAARHFCTSVREIFTQVLELRAPDADVFSAFPNCARTQKGNATRRSKIQFLLSKQGINNEALAEFASEDVDNVVELFDVLNGGTHGASGRLSIGALLQVKQRVEDGLFFLCRLAA